MATEIANQVSNNTLATNQAKDPVLPKVDPKAIEAVANVLLTTGGTKGSFKKNTGDPQRLDAVKENVIKHVQALAKKQPDNTDVQALAKALKDPKNIEVGTVKVGGFGPFGGKTTSYLKVDLGPNEPSVTFIGSKSVITEMSNFEDTKIGGFVNLVDNRVIVPTPSAVGNLSREFDRVNVHELAHTEGNLEYGTYKAELALSGKSETKWDTMYRVMNDYQGAEQIASYIEMQTETNGKTSVAEIKRFAEQNNIEFHDVLAGVMKFANVTRMGNGEFAAESRINNAAADALKFMAKYEKTKAAPGVDLEQAEHQIYNDKNNSAVFVNATADNIKTLANNGCMGVREVRVAYSNYEGTSVKELKAIDANVKAALGELSKTDSRAKHPGIIAQIKEARQEIVDRIRSAQAIAKSDVNQ